MYVYTFSLRSGNIYTVKLTECQELVQVTASMSDYQSMKAAALSEAVFNHLIRVAQFDCN